MDNRLDMCLAANESEDTKAEVDVARFVIGLATEHENARELVLDQLRVQTGVLGVWDSCNIVENMFSFGALGDLDALIADEICVDSVSNGNVHFEKVRTSAVAQISTSDTQTCGSLHWSRGGLIHAL